jgi:uracil-DNA glycosylase
MENWQDYFTRFNSKIQIADLSACIHESWDEPFLYLSQDPKCKLLEKSLEEDLKHHQKIYPFPMFVFKAFKVPVLSIKVVILGQDPYINIEHGIPQATGLSFSVPDRFAKPPSLVNIFKNLIKYGHLAKMPLSGNLEPLVSEGVLLLNSALTVREGDSNSHAKLWTWFTDAIIRFINCNFSDVTFVLWGRNAIAKSLILKPSTKIVMSSHPSPLGASKTCGVFPAFNNCDFAKDLNINWNVLS